MMEKEKKAPVKKASTPKLSGSEPKKAATKRKASTAALTMDGTVAKRAAAPRKKATSAGTGMMVSREEIARLAHRYWAERGHQHGHAEEDWLRAERELLGKAS